MRVSAAAFRALWALSTLQPAQFCPLIWRTWSPKRSPARAAGELACTSWTNTPCERGKRENIENETDRRQKLILERKQRSNSREIKQGCSEERRDKTFLKRWKTLQDDLKKWNRERKDNRGLMSEQLFQNELHGYLFDWNDVSNSNLYGLFWGFNTL